MNQNDVTQWLKDKPDDLQIDSYHFAVLDKMAEETGHIATCRIGMGPPPNPSGEGMPDIGPDEVTCLLQEARGAGLWLAGLDSPGYWEELLNEGLGYTPVL